MATVERLDLIGPDRPGIVFELTRTLAVHGINIETMTTDVTSGAMSGEAMFNATVEYSLSDSLSEDAFAKAIDEVANALTLEIDFNAETNE